jgi:hypothetical protein
LLFGACQVIPIADSLATAATFEGDMAIRAAGSMSRKFENDALCPDAFT